MASPSPKSPLLRLQARLLLAACFCLLPAPARAAEFTLPTVSAYNLDKDRLTLPADFTAALNLVVLCFDRDQQEKADAWLGSARPLRGAGVNVYYTPVFPRENMLYRWWMNSSMRSRLADATLWRWIVPLYLDRERFRRALGIDSDNEITVLLTDRQGRVLWRAEGELTEEKRAALVAALGGRNTEPGAQSPR